jgi:O-antigen ligase
MLAGFLPFVLANLHLYCAIDSWAEWPGFVKGAEFSVLDALAIAVHFSLPKARTPLPFRFSMGLYFFASLISTFQAEVPMAAVFYLWQLARMLLLYGAISRACAADSRVAPALLTGMAAALTIQAAAAIWQRFGLHILQASGTVGHQNTLGLMSHFIVFPFFALLLAGQRGRLPFGALLAGGVIEILTASRATLGLACVGYAAVFVLSTARQWTSRKAVTLLIAGVIAAVFLPFALSSIDRRGEAAMESSNDERVELEAAAAAMLADHPWGVGANEFAMAANVGGYYERAGVAWTSYDALVHNDYWLVAAETGYFGLIAFVLFLFRPLWVAILCGWQCRGDLRGDLLIGLGTALLLVYVHSGFEWIFLTFEPQYLFVMELGMVAGVAQQLGYWRRSYLRQPQTTLDVPSMMPSGNER